MPDTAAIEHQTGLTSGDFPQVDEPLRLFATWFAEAEASEPADPNAMALATVDADGLPNVRMVLMKGYDERGFVFYSNANSQKGTELAGNPRASLVFYWKSLKRQIRLRGTIHQVSDAEADAYFASRPRGAQIGAWASKQSAALESRRAFEQAIALHGAKFLVGAIPRPPNWTGYRLLPLIMEFWQDRPFRLHDRIEFRRDAIGVAWRKTRLYP